MFAGDAPIASHTAPIVEVVFKSSKTDPLRKDDKASSSEESDVSFVQILGNIFFSDDKYLFCGDITVGQQMDKRVQL